MPSGEREATYYIRHRGRTTGPFPAGELPTLVRRGALGRAHQISRDGQTWVAASAVPGLFGGTFDDAVAAAPTDASTADPMMFYAHGGDTFGPMPLPLLVALLRGGKVPADSQVWSDADPQRFSAYQHPQSSHVDVPESAANPESGASRPRSMGCGLMLLAFVGLCLAAGIYFAIDLSSIDKDTKTKKSPTTLNTTQPAATMPVDLPTSRPAATTAPHRPD